MGFVTILRTGLAYFLAHDLKDLEEFQHNIHKNKPFNEKSDEIYDRNVDENEISFNYINDNNNRRSNKYEKLKDKSEENVKIIRKRNIIQK